MTFLIKRAVPPPCNPIPADISIIPNPNCIVARPTASSMRPGITRLRNLFLSFFSNFYSNLTFL